MDSHILQDIGLTGFLGLVFIRETFKFIREHKDSKKGNPHSHHAIAESIQRIEKSISTLKGMTAETNKSLAILLERIKK